MHATTSFSLFNSGFLFLICLYLFVSLPVCLIFMDEEMCSPVAAVCQQRKWPVKSFRVRVIRQLYIFFNRALPEGSIHVYAQVWLPYPLLGESLEGSCRIPPPPTTEEDSDEPMSMMGQWFRVQSAQGVYTVRKKCNLLHCWTFSAHNVFIWDHFTFIFIFALRN